MVCVRILLSSLLVVGLGAEDYIAIEAHRAELALLNQRIVALEEARTIERDIGLAYQLLALELLRDRADERAAIRKRLSFLVMDVLPSLPHKKEHRLWKEFSYVDEQLRTFSRKGILP